MRLTYKKTQCFKVLTLMLCFIVLFQSYVKAKPNNLLPKPSENIYVQDTSQVIDEDTKLKLKELANNAYSEGLCQIVTVTIPSLNNENLEQYSTSLFNEWGIGDKEKNNGILLLIVTKDRKIRLEIGKGINHIITDKKAGEIIEGAKNYLKNDSFNEGALYIYNHSIETLLNISNKNNNTSSANPPIIYNKTTDPTTSNGIKIFSFLFIIIVVSLVLRHALKSQNNNSYNKSNNNYSKPFDQEYDDSIERNGDETSKYYALGLLHQNLNEDDNKFNNSINESYNDFNSFGGGSSDGGGSSSDF
ncbi:TPM domain-containing protein [Desnuesiella massiliensis]|uniref:TPM domain-containing protein n=1 Tax=Desnuesiella massiliensis TaxID=1650662 RepID=UPI0006E2CDCE|nr:TPM domain-containing protein [Desnuesiella massiliensis]